MNPDQCVTADCIGIVVAAGNGSRAGILPKIASSGSPEDNWLEKQFWQLGDKPVLAHSLDRLQANPRIKNIIIVTSKPNIAGVISQFGGTNRHIVEGGATRQQSVYAGLQAAAKIDPTAAFVAIHDAARPLLPPDLLDKMLAKIDDTLAGVVPALPLADSLATIDAQQLIDGNLDRAPMRALQTPQLFWRALITELHQRFADDQRFTDDCGLALAAGHKVATISGSQQLLKLTQPDDYAMLQLFCDATPVAARQNMPDIRIGNGFDVHKFADIAGPIMLAGIRVDSDRAILAHSDGDVGLHALCDAVFGALADGDIGHHFPPSDPQWQAADSALFLKFAMQLVRARNATVMNLDLTIICETPKIGPLRDQMRARIATITKLPVERIAVKATTSEKLGFAGRGEGIAAQATASILLPDDANDPPQAPASQS
jgi:2-C-methyl-D-erythritol 4-phosphate cytidylyltransferase / 2-C-methyl-D-erythritol 2,4-cyclodiphosphate synthase